MRVEKSFDICPCDTWLSIFCHFDILSEYVSRYSYLVILLVYVFCPSMLVLSRYSTYEIHYRCFVPWKLNSTLLIFCHFDILLSIFSHFDILLSTFSYFEISVSIFCYFANLHSIFCQKIRRSRLDTLPWSSRFLSSFTVVLLNLKSLFFQLIIT